MSTLLKKSLFSFLAFLVIFASFAPNVLPVKAQDEENSNWYKQDFVEWYTKVYDPDNASEIFGERYTAAQVEWVIYGVFAFILNHVSDQGTSVECIGGDAGACTDAIKQAVDKIKGLVSDSNLPNRDKSLAALVFEERSFSGIGYIKEMIGDFKLVPEVKAQTQGFGFGALDPIKRLWAASRNAAYGLIVLVTIILAFMIMFRVKISPQVVISVQSAIPKVALALVFVTFSYAIAGLLVDLMYVVIGLMSLILGQVYGDPALVYNAMTEGAPGLGLGFLGLMVMYSVTFFWVLLFTLFASGNLAVNVIISPILIIFFILVIIVVAIVFIIMFFKILWLLLKTLANLYLLVIVGPLQIMLGTVAQGMGVGTWMRGIAANLAVYPLVGTFFMVSYLFLIYAVALGLGNLPGNITELVIGLIFPGANVDLPTATWNPPLTFGTTYIPLIFVGVSFAILTLIPKTAEIIQGFISGKPFAYGTAIGEALAPAQLTGRAGGSYLGAQAEAAYKAASGRAATTGAPIPGGIRGWEGVFRAARAVGIIK